MPLRTPSSPVKLLDSEHSMPHPALSHAQLTTISTQLKSCNTCIQLKGLQILQSTLSKHAHTSHINVSTSSAASLVLVGSGLLRYILPLLRSNELPLQEAAWKLLQFLTPSPRGSTLSPVRSPMSRLITHLAYLCRTGPSPMCKQEASHALRWLSQPDCSAIIRADVLPLMIKAVQAVPVPTQQATSAAMSELCEQAVIVNLVEVLASVAEHSDQGRDQVVQAGAVKSLVRLLTCDSVLCQQAALQVLVVLSWGQDRHRDVIMEEGIVPGLVTVLQKGFIPSAPAPVAAEQLPGSRPAAAAGTAVQAAEPTASVRPVVQQVPAGSSTASSLDLLDVMAASSSSPRDQSVTDFDILASCSTVCSNESNDDLNIMSSDGSMESGPSARHLHDAEFALCYNTAPQLRIEEPCSQPSQSRQGLAARRSDKAARHTAMQRSKCSVKHGTPTEQTTGQNTTSSSNRSSRRNVVSSSSTRSLSNRPAGHRRSSSLPEDGFSLDKVQCAPSRINGPVSSSGRSGGHSRSRSLSQAVPAAKAGPATSTSASSRIGSSASRSSAGSRITVSGAASQQLPGSQPATSRAPNRTTGDSTHHRSLSHPVHRMVSSPLASPSSGHSVRPCAHSRPGNDVSSSRERSTVTHTSSSTSRASVTALSHHRRTQSAIPHAPARDGISHATCSAHSSHSRGSRGTNGGSVGNSSSSSSSSRFISHIPSASGVLAPASHSSNTLSSSSAGVLHGTFRVNSHSTLTHPSHAHTPLSAATTSLSVRDTSSAAVTSPSLSHPPSPAAISTEGVSRENSPPAVLSPVTPLPAMTIPSIAPALQMSVSSSQLSRIHNENKCDAAAVLYELVRDSPARTACVKRAGAVGELMSLAVRADGSDELKTQAAVTAWQLLVPRVAGPQAAGLAPGVMLQDIFVSMVCQGGPGGL